MKHIAFPTVLCASLALGFAVAPPSAAQVDELVEEYVATPIDLATLLGEAGLEGAGCEFYLRMAAGGMDGVIHWKTAVEDDQFVFTMAQGRGGESQNLERQVFDADGAFVESSRVTESPDFRSSEVIVREGDKVRVVSSHSFGGNAPENTEEVLDYQPLDDAISTSWLPIAFAYHFREGHDLFTIRMSEDTVGRSQYIQVYNCEDIGTEMIELGGEEVEAHVIMLTLDTEVGGADGFQAEPGEQVMQMYVLADGSIARMHMEGEGMTMHAEAITAEEAEALAGDSEEGADGAVEESAE